MIQVKATVISRFVYDWLFALWHRTLKSTKTENVKIGGRFTSIVILRKISALVGAACRMATGS
jgi:hypothetical protein